jgi:glycosyltransferase involved in cell wall biosynthesis
VKVVVLTTSYPRFPGDVAGVFVADAVEHLRAAGVEIEVVSPASFRHFGLAFGSGIVQNLRARPWLVAAIPLFLAAYAQAARRAARDADLVHAHWLPSALAALATRRPFVLQVWGTDVELARRAPWLARLLVRRARLVIAASSFLADEARRLGAREVRVIPNGVAIPETVGEPADPPHVLFVGRLSEEKGILEFLEATDGLQRVIVGDGPLRSRVAEAVGFVPPAELGSYYERAAVICVPSRREGYGVVAREAMAHCRPVIATRVGGLLDLEDGTTGLLVSFGDPAGLRAAIERLLADAELRARMGERGRAHVEQHHLWAVAAASLKTAYELTVLQRRGPATGAPEAERAEAD